VAFTVIIVITIIEACQKLPTWLPNDLYGLCGHICITLFAFHRGTTGAHSSLKHSNEGFPSTQTVFCPFRCCQGGPRMLTPVELEQLRREMRADGLWAKAELLTREPKSR
jgi:hypothetical protein